jgi:hypothetical protein
VGQGIGMCQHGAAEMANSGAVFREILDDYYSIFGIGVDRNRALKWLFPQEKATLHAPQKVYVYSGNALAENNLGFEALNWEP